MLEDSGSLCKPLEPSLGPLEPSLEDFGHIEDWRDPPDCPSTPSITMDSPNHRSTPILSLPTPTFSPNMFSFFETSSLLNAYSQSPSASLSLLNASSQSLNASLSLLNAPSQSFSDTLSLFNAPSQSPSASLSMPTASSPLPNAVSSLLTMASQSTCDASFSLSAYLHSSVKKPHVRRRINFDEII